MHQVLHHRHGWRNVHLGCQGNMDAHLMHNLMLSDVFCVVMCWCDVYPDLIQGLF